MRALVDLRVLRILSFCAGLTVCACAIAEPLFLDRFDHLYNPAKGSDLDKAQCKTCHDLRNGPPARNPFGARLESLINPAYTATDRGGVSRDILVFVENEDSDGDGYTNLEEIIAGTLPGDPKSHPAKHITNLPHHEMSRHWNSLYLELTGALFGIGILLTVAAKAGKQNSMKGVAIGAFALGALAAAGTVIEWLISNRHP